MQKLKLKFKMPIQEGTDSIKKEENMIQEVIRVLVVDDNIVCLKWAERCLVQCGYKVTTETDSDRALQLLKQNKNSFDLVITDVHMPNKTDGFRLLEIVGLQMKIPVVMMSGDKDTKTVLRAVKHGACDYLVKPVRIEEIDNIWQHVYRKKAKAPKIKRFTWTPETYSKFVDIVSTLGVAKADPSKILEMMDMEKEGLTRKKVYNHLYRYRCGLIKGVHRNSPSNEEQFVQPETLGGSVGNLQCPSDNINQQSNLPDLPPSLQQFPMVHISGYPPFPEYGTMLPGSFPATPTMNSHPSFPGHFSGVDNVNKLENETMSECSSCYPADNGDLTAGVEQAHTRGKEIAKEQKQDKRKSLFSSIFGMSKP